MVSVSEESAWGLDLSVFLYLCNFDMGTDGRIDAMIEAMTPCEADPVLPSLQ